jgi:SAM-dependent methyltransferase
MTGCRATVFLQEVAAWRNSLAQGIAEGNPRLSERALHLAVQAIIDLVVFLRLGEERGLKGAGALSDLLKGARVYDRLSRLSRDAAAEGLAGLKIADRPLRDVIEALYRSDRPYRCSELPVEILGQIYEQSLGNGSGRTKAKKAAGVYYTSAPLVDYIVRHTLEKLLVGQALALRVVDPACGSGFFLLGAYQYLLAWQRDWLVADGPQQYPTKIVQGPDGAWRLTLAEKRRILLGSIHGVDIDARAVAVARRSLLLKMLEGEAPRTVSWAEALLDLSANIQAGDALLGAGFNDPGRGRRDGFDWRAAFPQVSAGGGFQAVIGNPPWGQKAVEASAAAKAHLGRLYPSSRGIFELSRPFIERGIRLLADGGRLGLVLPDIILLKDYAETRRFVLEQLSLDRIDWWGNAFAAASIDAATLIGTKRAAPPGHRVLVAAHEKTAFSQTIPQADFWANPRFAFNLYLTPEKRQLLEQLQSAPRLGDYFEIHEGVHSGNIRADLFVSARLDESCRELYFGRGEIAPFLLRWQGGYLRLAAFPATKTLARYANLGKPAWHEREKLLVRRTGDYILAAVDRERRYASNNFFLVFARDESRLPKAALNLDGLGALLNSRFMTAYFRTIEPRRGRVFAELKIKHLRTFPLPAELETCHALNRLGQERAFVAARERAARLDAEIEGVVRASFALPESAYDSAACALAR